MKKVSVILIGSLFASNYLVAAEVKSRKIEFRMTPGESVHYALHAETTTEYVSYRSRGTQKGTMAFKADMRVLMRCLNVSDTGVVHAEITYPDFYMETTVTEDGRTNRIVSDENGAMSYVDGKLQEHLTWEDLEKQGRPNLKKLFSSLIGISLDKTGKVLDVKAPVELATRFTWVDVKSFFRNQVIYPEVAIAPGAEWNDVTEREALRGPGPLGGKIILDQASYQYQKDETAMGRECARIWARVTSRPKEEVPALKEFKQTSEGWSLISLENGQLVLSEMQLFQQMKGTPGGIETEVKTTGNMKTTLMQPPSQKATSAEGA